MLALGLLRGPAAVYGARAHDGACASVCATHVHRSKLLFEMELDEIRYPPVLHEHMPHVRRSWPPDARSRHVVILKVGGAQPNRVLERYA